MSDKAIDNAAAIQEAIRAVFRDMGNLLIQTAGATSDPDILNTMRPVIMSYFSDEYTVTARNKLQSMFDQLSTAVK